MQATPGAAQPSAPLLTDGDASRSESLDRSATAQAPAPHRTAESASAAACGGGGNKSYRFRGHLAVDADWDDDGSVETIDLEGVQLRIVRAGSPIKWAQGPDVVTDENGDYDVTCTFARDRNGVAPGGKKIRFKVMARFRDDEFKIRKAGWAKNNWFEVGRRRGCNRSGGLATPKCRDHNFTGIDKTFDTNNTAGKHAYMWWFFNRLEDDFEQENVGLTDRPVFKRKLTVSYPNRFVFQDGSFFLFNVHLEQGDWNAHETMIHEFMHRWDVGNLGGEGHFNCLLDAHHEPPTRWNSSRCSGFMEGFAEATAEGINAALYGGSIDPETHEALQNGTTGHGYSVRTRDEAERTDVGWENFLQLILVDNEMRFVDGSASCDPTDVGVFEMLRVLQADRSRKADWYKLRPNATFSWFTDILQTHLSDFTAEDAEIYQNLGDPSLSASEICPSTSGNLTTTTVPRTPRTPVIPNTGSTDFSGVWDTRHGELRLHQVDNLVVGDYADRGIIVGKVQGSCLAGVFTNGERNGIFRFSASGDDRFQGQWAWHGNALNSQWTGTRTADAVNELHNFTRDNATTPVLDNDRTVYDGTYSSNHGTIDLVSRDLILVGDYANRGILAGAWDGNSFVGRFTNGERTGWFDFAFLSKTGSFRSGQWGWVGEGQSGTWTLSEQSESRPTLDNITEDVSCN